MIEYITVPLVVYDKDGRRNVIGEATIKGSEIMAVLSPEAGNEIVDMLEMSATEFCIKPYKKHRKIKEQKDGHEEAEEGSRRGEAEDQRRRITGVWPEGSEARPGTPRSEG